MKYPEYSQGDMTDKQKSQFDNLFKLVTNLFKNKFSGKVVLNFNCGGITRVEEVKSYEI